MLFNTFEFLFFFVAAVVVYYILQNRFRWLWLLIISYYFYFAWEPKLVLLLLASTIFDYYCGIKIYDSKTEGKRKFYLIISIIFSLGLLIFFKYLGFFTETSLKIMQFFGVEVSEKELLRSSHEFSRILIPVGISFYTFQSLGYVVDVYRRNVIPERHFGKYALFVSFFPQLVAGPIERAKNFIPQLQQKIVLNVESIRIGLMLMAWGYFMKMVAADRLGIYVDIVFNNPEKYQGIPLIVGAYFFTFQIYFDFAAYSIIAIGAARVMGFELMTNFNRPLFSKDASEFWKRWHISLMSWLRDYLYLSLVKSWKMSRHSALFLVFVLSGLWHGASWNFVFWGGMNGAFIILEIASRNARAKLEKLLYPVIPPVLAKFTWWFISFHFIVFSLIFFRASTIQAAFNYIGFIPSIHDFEISVLNSKFEMILCFLLIVFVQLINYFKRDNQVHELIINRNPVVRWSIYLLFIFVIVFFSAIRNNPFIYFQF